MTDLWHRRAPARPVAKSDDVTLTHPDGAITLTVRWSGAGKPRGVVVFCHGLGSSRSAYGGLTEVWAAHGYVVIQPTFPDAITVVAQENPELGLDPSQDLTGWMATPDLRAHMHGILLNPDYWLHRVRLVRQVMDGLNTVLAQTCGAVADLPCAIAGHSFGAYTAQLFAGAEIDLPGQGATRFRDDRFAAALILSGQGLDQQGLRAGSWDGLTGPVLTVTGTKDGGAGGQDWNWKCQPFELGPPGDKALLVLTDGNHYLGGFGMDGGVPAQTEALRAVTLAFLDTHLGRDDRAGDWLGGIGDAVGDAPVLFKAK